MNKRTIGIVGVVLVLIGGVLLWTDSSYRAKQAAELASSYKNATYTIEGQAVTLQNGSASVAIVPGSVLRADTSYFGNEAVGDLNGDGVPDVAFILTQSTGGSGTFYYIVAALKTAEGYEGTNAILLGDRIAPQTTMIKDGQITVNFADRSTGQPMTAQPSVGVSKIFAIHGTTLFEAAPVASEAGKHCGGNMRGAYVCATGYHCAPTPGSHLPFGDVGGTCVAN